MKFSLHTEWFCSLMEVVWLFSIKYFFFHKSFSQTKITPYLGKRYSLRSVPSFLRLVICICNCCIWLTIEIRCASNSLRLICKSSNRLESRTTSIDENRLLTIQVFILTLMCWFFPVIFDFSLFVEFNTIFSEKEMLVEKMSMQEKQSMRKSRRVYSWRLKIISCKCLYGREQID